MSSITILNDLNSVLKSHFKLNPVLIRNLSDGLNRTAIGYSSNKTILSTNNHISIQVSDILDDNVDIPYLYTFLSIEDNKIILYIKTYRKVYKLATLCISQLLTIQSNIKSFASTALYPFSSNKPNPLFHKKIYFQLKKLGTCLINEQYKPDVAKIILKGISSPSSKLSYLLNNNPLDNIQDPQSNFSEKLEVIKKYPQLFCHKNHDKLIYSIFRETKQKFPVNETELEEDFNKLDQIFSYLPDSKKGNYIFLLLNQCLYNYFRILFDTTSFHELVHNYSFFNPLLDECLNLKANLLKHKLTPIKNYTYTITTSYNPKKMLSNLQEINKIPFDSKKLISKDSTITKYHLPPAKKRKSYYTIPKNLRLIKHRSTKTQYEKFLNTTKFNLPDTFSHNRFEFKLVKKLTLKIQEEICKTKLINIPPDKPIYVITKSFYKRFIGKFIAFEIPSLYSTSFIENHVSIPLSNDLPKKITAHTSFIDSFNSLNSVKFPLRPTHCSLSVYFTQPRKKFTHLSQCNEAELLEISSKTTKLYHYTKHHTKTKIPDNIKDLFSKITYNELIVELVFKLHKGKYQVPLNNQISNILESIKFSNHVNTSSTRIHIPFSLPCKFRRTNFLIVPTN